MSNFRMEIKGYKELKKKLESLRDNVNPFMIELTKEITKRLLEKVIMNTPTGNYSDNVQFTTKDGKNVSFKVSYKKQGGKLKKAWEDARDNIVANHEGLVFKVEIINPVPYAFYVEYGHRKVNNLKMSSEESKATKTGWVEGQFIFTDAKKEIEADLEKIIGNKLKTFFQGGK